MNHQIMILAVGRNAQPWGAFSVYQYLKQECYDVGFIHLYDHTILHLWGGGATLPRVERPPWIVGLSTYTTTAPQTMRIAREIRARWPRTKIVIGGRHICWDTIDRDGDEWFALADYLVVGDGEYAMQKIIAGEAERGVVNGTWLSVEDMARLPLPSQEFAARNIPDNRRGELLFSRGCPYRCTFCGSDRPHVIHIDPDRAARYLADWAQWFGKFPIFIMDDVFTANRQWLIDFACAYERHAAGIPIRCFIHGRQFDESLVGILKRFKLAQVSLGAESGNDGILQTLNKGTTVARYREIADLCRRENIRLHCLWMVGHPGETPATLRDTVQLARSIGDDPGHASYAIPFPGTAFWKQAPAAGEILDWDYSHWDNRHVIFRPHDLRTEQLKGARMEIIR